MKRYVTFVVSTTLVALCIAGGHIESVMKGYSIRQLEIRKLVLSRDVDELEYNIAKITTPDYLENQMRIYNVNLANPKMIKLAKVLPTDEIGSNDLQKDEKTIYFAKLFLGTAQADVE